MVVVIFDTVAIFVFGLSGEVCGVGDSGGGGDVLLMWCVVDGDNIADGGDDVLWCTYFVGGWSVNIVVMCCDVFVEGCGL